MNSKLVLIDMLLNFLFYLRKNEPYQLACRFIFLCLVKMQNLFRKLFEVHVTEL